MFGCFKEENKMFNQKTTINTQETAVQTPIKESFGTKCARFGKKVLAFMDKAVDRIETRTEQVVADVDKLFTMISRFMRSMLHLAVQASIIVIALIMMYNFAKENPEIAAPIINAVQTGVNTAVDFFVDFWQDFMEIIKPAFQIFSVR
jgi:ABC-type proline/glycine betaine transport system permease subunit